MWKPINNCDKQIVLHSRLRETVDNSFLIYEVISVEFDQYKLQLIIRDNQTVTEKIQHVLNCEQLSQYHFEVEQPQAVE